MEGSIGLRKGAWCKEEDDTLKACVERYGEGKWHLVPTRAGLNRCRKSCRLRWLNYLKPNIKRGEFSEDEVDLMIRMHRLLGNRWSLIAGRLPGRTANDVKNYWNTKVVRNKVNQSSPSFSKENTTNTNDIITAKPKETSATGAVVIKPQPRTFSRTSPLKIDSAAEPQESQENVNIVGAKQVTRTADDAAAVLEDNNGGGNEGNSLCSFDDEKDWNIEEFITENGDLLIEGQSWSWSWSDLLIDSNFWDS